MLVPFDHIFTQPYAARDKSIENEAEYARKFYDLARQNSPDVQAWLYSAWPDKSMGEPRTQGQGSAAPLNLPPAVTWQDGVTNNTKFVEAVRAKASEDYSGKPILIVPAGLALATLKTEIEAGRAGPERLLDGHGRRHSASFAEGKLLCCVGILLLPFQGES